MAGACCVTVLLATSCSDEVEVPSLRTAAREFSDAWQSLEAESMLERLSEDSADDWTAAKLGRRLDKRLAAGQIESFEVRPGTVEQPEVASEEELAGLEATVPYTITYESAASDEPVELAGELDAVYESGWRFDWDEGALWPGIDGADGFQVEVTAARRGAILDRNGKALAKGPPRARRYPHGSVGGSTIGHIGPTKVAGKGAEAAGSAGASGLEAALDEELSAASGASLVVIDAAGVTLETLGRRAPGVPTDIRVTLDIDIQNAAENAYGGTVGGAVVIDPETGDLLAIVSSSPFDPNNYVGVAGIEPFNRALSGSYPPGSAMKVVTASAALDTGLVKPTTPISGPGNYKGVHNFESGEFGTIPFSVATQNSVNTAYAQIAEDLGAKVMTEYAERFGFNKAPGMPLEAATPSFPRPEDLSDLMWSAIGQAQVLATPLEMATVAATIANDGMRMEPRIVLDDPVDGERAVSQRTAQTMTDLMEMVVTGGTGQAANLGTPSVAGKTGTAEVSVGGGIQNHAWFVCFAPSDDPEIAVAVVSELGGVGGEVAAPLARQILQAVLPLV